MSILTEPVRSTLNSLFSRSSNGNTPGWQQKLAQYFWNVQASRFFHYRDFLTLNRERYEWVMLTDVRDVIFQADPFRHNLVNGLHVFEEYPNISLGDQEANRNWIRSLYGENELKKLEKCPIICSGVTMGSISEMIDYLDAMCNELAKKSGPVGFDQGVHNFLIRNGVIRNLHIHEFNEGPVVHVGIAPREVLSLSQDNQLIDKYSRLIPVVHQYDRHKDLTKLFANS